MNLLDRIIDSFRLKDERENFDVIYDAIDTGIEFRATNLWILIFAILIASVGLNVNSTAVVIGAMLISPMMGPIMGIGYSVAIYDFILLRKSIYNYSFAVGTALFASTIYFLISPLNAEHSELLARTSPNIYDVLIAMFGGLAGIIAVGSRKKGNVIPGVAIATALMPPLCTAGYGLATAQWNFFFGAFYLFIINSVFITLATLTTTRLFRFPVSKKIDTLHVKLANRWITFITLITITPSIYFGYTLIQKDRFLRNSNNFISKETFVAGNYLLKGDIDYKTKEIKLVYAGRNLSDGEKRNMTERLKEYNLSETRVVFQQGLTIEEDKKPMEGNLLSPEVNRLLIELEKKNESYDSLSASMMNGENILREIKTFYPYFTDCSTSPSVCFSADTLTKPSEILLVVLSVKKGTRRKVSDKKTVDWLKARFPGQQIDLVIREK